MLTYLTVRCDWPGCQAERTVPYYPDSLHDYDWHFVGPWQQYPATRHLCPEHRFKTEQELDAALVAISEEEGHTP